MATGYFVSYLTSITNSAANAEQIIIAATTNTIWVETIIITNLGNDDIRINLQFKRTYSSGTIVNTFLAKNFLIPSYQNPKAYGSNIIFNTVDLVQLLGIRKNLQYTSDYWDKLICYTNGPTQYYDCTIDYALLNELP